MKKLKQLLTILALMLTGVMPAAGLEVAARSLLAGRYTMELGNANAKRSIRGARALWVELNVQRPPNAKGMDSMEADLMSTDLEGQLNKAEFKTLDPKKRSLALGLRPTLQLLVLYAPKDTEGNSMDMYLVIARATQEVKPLGGDALTLTTWLKASEPIVASGDAQKDIDAIRKAARAGVRSFIDTAQDNDESPAKK